MASNNLSKPLRFSLATFQDLPAPDLIINIWSYNWSKHLPCSACNQYSEWCKIALKKKWRPEWGDFHCAVEKLKKQDEDFINVDNFSNLTKNKIIDVLIEKNKYI